MMIGKPQHGTHIYSIDIHTLELFKKALNNPSYACLSAEGKEVLQHAAIMHDYGKMGHIKSPGHAKLSRAYAEKVLASNDNIPQDVKNRILNLIENHHWFEAYNKGYMSPDEFAKIFPTWEDRVIAMILAFALSFLAKYIIKSRDFDIYELEIVNHEVMRMFRKLVKGWFSKNRQQYGSFIRSLLKDDVYSSK